MKTIRLYYPENYLLNSTLEISGDTFHHGIKVLRCRLGDQLELFDGVGNVAVADLVAIGKRTATIAIRQLKKSDRESPLQTLLVQAVSKGERMDWVLQKATELGVSQIQPVITQRCNVQLDKARWEKRFLHWQRVIISACEQSGRNTLPELKVVLQFDDYLENCDSQQCFILHPEEGLKLQHLKIDNNLPIGFLIGPEGGFTDEEVLQSEKYGVKTITLGTRVLRTETAGISVIAVAQAFWGDL